MFWNTAGKQCSSEVRSICQNYNVDIVILAEQKFDSREMLTALNTEADASYTHIPTLQRRLSLFTRFPLAWFETRFESGHAVIQQIRIPIARPIILASVHLPSKLHITEADHSFYAANLLDAITNEERRQGHRHTIVIGDFNMDPFEAGMTMVGGLHALMDRKITTIEGRRINGRNYPMFYNPMWSLLGDGSKGPPGTYFYNSGHPLNYYWHTFDQLLLRPELLEAFTHENLHVVTKAGDSELLRRNGRIDGSISDHLPIVIRLDIEGRF